MTQEKKKGTGMRVKLPIGGAITLPAGYEPSTYVFLGPMDGGGTLASGPTMVKTVAHQIRRTITLSMAGVGDAELPPGTLARALDEAKKACGGTVTEVGDRQIQGRPEMHALMRHRQGALNVVSMVAVLHANECVWSFIHSCLDDPNAIKAMRADHEALIASLDFSAK
jgi:hypothetical protein